jgi:uncharacterized peroxidase-related enzyme
MLAEYQIPLAPLTLETAQGEGKLVLEKAVKQVGFLPNMYARMVHSPGLLNTYLDGYATFRQNSGFDSVEQEVIFLTISRVNGCEYCVSAHSALADMKSKVPTAVTDAIRDGEPIPDARLAALSRFVAVMVRTRGLPARADVAAFHAAGYSDRHVLEVVLAIAVKTLSNYANHLFHTPLDPVFAGRAWEARVVA